MPCVVVECFKLLTLLLQRGLLLQQRETILSGLCTRAGHLIEFACQTLHFHAQIQNCLCAIVDGATGTGHVGGKGGAGGRLRQEGNVCVCVEVSVAEGRYHTVYLGVAGAAAPVAWAELSSIYVVFFLLFLIFLFPFLEGNQYKFIPFFVLFFVVLLMSDVCLSAFLLLLLLLPLLLPAPENKLTPHTYHHTQSLCECVCVFACLCLCACVSPFLFCAAIHSGTMERGELN